jgi:hypothetical protein
VSGVNVATGFSPSHMRKLLSLLALLFLYCATVRTPEATVRAYLAAETHAEALALLAPEYRLWFGTRSGAGMDRDRAAKMLEWDFALHPRHRVTSVVVRGNEVTAQVHEDNDFSLLIGFPGWDSTSTYTVENGRITSQLYVPTGPTEWRPYLDAPLAWIREHHPDALPRVFPNGKLSQTRESAREWVSLLRAWRMATKPSV